MLSRISVNGRVYIEMGIVVLGPGDVYGACVTLEPSWVPC
jgi:hypothetical protein